MSELSGAQAPQPLSSQEIAEYKNKFDSGLQLFQQSFNEFTKPNIETHKKEQLHKVMDEALQVMNETAAVALKGQKKAIEQKLNAEYNAFIQNPSPQTQQAVTQTLKALT